MRTTTAAHLKSEVKDKLAQLRTSLDPAEQTLLVLRVDREMSWQDIAVVMSAEGETVSAPALRKRFERLTDRIRKLAQDAGLIPR